MSNNKYAHSSDSKAKKRTRPHELAGAGPRFEENQLGIGNNLQESYRWCEIQIVRV